MNVLLDTCTFLWINLDAPELSARARQICMNPEHRLYLSAVSSWEIAVKQGAGRLVLPEPASRYIPRRREANGIKSLSLREEAVLQLTKLPPIHSDPFDRLLICQAIAHSLIFLTPDEMIRRYPVRTVW